MGYYCGWDGGGSKTGVLCSDESGRELDRRGFGSLNLNGAAEECVEKTISDALDFMKTVGALRDCRGLVIGAAGVSNGRVSAFIKDKLRGFGYTGKLSVVGDHEIALEGAVRGAGAVLIAGTGSICFGKDERGNMARAGGYGYLIDDGGSGYAIGRDILAAVVRAQDGRGCETCLTEMVMNTLGATEIRDIIAWLYGGSAGKKEVAALAPLLNQALDAGDEAAKKIALDASGKLAELAVAVWRRLNIRNGELALTGSILEHYPMIRDETGRLCREFFPEMNVIAPRGDACEGAVKLAMRL